jgi:hypothetical protein
MNIVVAHIVESYTTGNYFRKSLGQAHTVTYLSEHPESIGKICSGLPIQNILPKDKVDLLLYIDPVGQFFPTGVRIFDLSYCHLFDRRSPKYRTTSSDGSFF